MKKSSIYDGYYAAQKELEEKYGEQSVVLMQVGSFYEVYGVNIPDTEKGEEIKIGHVEEVGDILSMKVSRKNGLDKPHSRSNPMMAGFPDHALGNHLAKLLKVGYTVGIYDQFDNPSGKKKDKKERKLVNIYSSSTYIDEDIPEASSLLVIDLNKYKCPINKKNIEYFKCAIIDLKTGDTLLTETYNTATDNYIVDSQLHRLLYTYNPSEIIVCEGSGDRDFSDRFECENRKVSYIPLQKCYTRVSYQEQYLKDIYFKKVNTISPIDQLGLTKHSSLIPHLIHGLSYISERNSQLILHVKQPVILNDNNQLILNNDSIYQLHLINTNIGTNNNPTKIRCVFDLLNKTRTGMGKRLLKTRMLSPTTNIDELQYRYSLIKQLCASVHSSKEEYMYMNYDVILRNIADTELMYSKMSAKRLHPYELANLDDTFVSIKKLITFADITFLIDDDVIEEFDKFYSEYINTFDLTILREYKIGKIKSSFFVTGVYEELDNIQQSILDNEMLIQELSEKISAAIDGKFKNVTVESSLDGAIHLKTSNVRFAKIPETFKCKLSDGSIIRYSELEVIKLKSVSKITCDYIKQKANLIISSRKKLVPTITKKYFETLEDWCSTYKFLFERLSYVIAEIDFTMSSARVATENKYVEPIIKIKTKPPRGGSEKETAHFNAKNLRHPIIEKIVTKTPYVNNDFTSGKKIIYGVNMSGKSSLLRSIGIAIVMAQAGMYVPASSFEFYPFKSLLSRITVQDNYFKGQSLFMVEVEEINNMIRRADKNTMVLSDELCSSTETDSAHAMVASTLKRLSKNNANFVFSTHLHELQSITDIANDESIDILHFDVTIGMKEVVFNRKLQKGGISNTYGLEIASALGLPEDFIQDAFEIRDRLRINKGCGNNSILTTKESRFSKDVFMKECSLCRSRKSLGTHHILFQCTAKKGVIMHKGGPIHKDDPFNLIVVCRDCHIRIHQFREKIEIKPLRIEIM